VSQVEQPQTDGDTAAPTQTQEPLVENMLAAVDRDTPPELKAPPAAEGVSAAELEARLALTRRRINIAAGAIVYYDLNRKEGELTDREQRVIELIYSGLTLEDADTALHVAVDIERWRQPGHGDCHSRGVVIRNGSFSACACVLRAKARGQYRAQAQAKAKAPGAAASTVERERASRLAQARTLLQRAEAAQTAACAPLDEKIAKAKEDLRAFNTASESLRDQIEVNGVDAAVAENNKKAAAEQIANHRRLRTAAREDLTHTLSAIETDGTSVDTELAIQRNHAIALINRICGSRHDEALTTVYHDKCAAKACAHREHAAQLQYELDQLVAKNAPAVAQLDALKAERARIARHHEPRIEQARKRVRRLEFVNGTSAPSETA